MDGLDHWRICDELSVIQAALLIAGLDPGEECVGEYVEEWDANKRPSGYDAVKSALVNAIQGGRLSATLRHRGRARQEEFSESGGLMSEEPFFDDIEIRKTWLMREVEPGVVRVKSNTHTEYESGPIFICDKVPNWHYSTVMVDDLREWLRGRGISSGFFFPEPKSQREYLDRQHERYAPKLVAAVSAWENAKVTPGKSPKSQLQKWLREHAAEFALTDEEGNLNQEGIEEVAKVANWQPGGGAPKTPG